MRQDANTFSTLFAGPMRLRLGLFLLFALGILIISMTFFALSIGKPYMGITLSMGKQGWMVESLDANGAASLAGIRQGDIPTGINGQSADVFLDKFKKSRTVFGMSFRELTVINGRGQLNSVNLEASSLSGQSVIQQIAWSIICLVLWIGGFFVFFQKTGNTAALLLCLFGMAVGLALSGNIAAAVGLPTALQLHIIAYIIGPWLLLQFFLVLPEERTRLRKNPLLYLIYLPVAVTLVLLPLVGWTEGQPVQWFRTIRLLEAGGGLLAAAVVAIFNYFGAVSVRTRQQMKIVLLSSIAALVPV